MNSKLQDNSKLMMAVGFVLTIIMLFLRNEIETASGYVMVELILVSSMLITVPISIASRLKNIKADGLTRTRNFLYSLALICSAFSIFIPLGTASALLTLPWLVYALLIALIGFKTLCERGFNLGPELFIDIALLYFPVGASWFFFSRLGYDLLGFSPFIVTLTAIHFHIAGVSLSSITGQIGRLELPKNKKLYLYSGLLVSLTPILVAIGINSSPLIEVVMGILLSLGAMLLALYLIVSFFKRDFSSLRGKSKSLFFILTVAHSVSFFTLTLASIFAIGEYFEVSFLNFDQMVKYHGQLNYFFFVLPSMIVLQFLEQKVERQQIEFQKIAGKKFVGTDFFGDTSLKGEEVKGLYDDFQNDFKLGKLEESILKYFENTSSVRLVCHANWLGSFKFFEKFVNKVGRAIGQLVMPLSGRIYQIDNKLFKLKIDGAKERTVGSMRTYRSGDPMYITSYTLQRLKDKSLMNISLPIPFGQLHSILQVKTIPGRVTTCGLELSSFGDDDMNCGLWLELFGWRLKIPLREHLIMWDKKEMNEMTKFDFSSQVEEASLAFHEFWFLGLKCLELRYVVAMKSDCETLSDEKNFLILKRD